MASHRRRRGTAAIVVLLLAAAAAVAVGPMLWDRYGDEAFSTQQCTVTLGERSDTKTAEQANNIGIIVAGSIRHDMPARAATIAVATAIQESSLRNIDYGDRDSIGLFQQRPSQGWGTVEQIMDPYYSTDQFYEALVRVDGWQQMEVTEAAQAVQRSAFPEAYADHEEEGRLWASALTGHGGEVQCSLSQVPTTTASEFISRVASDFGTEPYAFSVSDSGAGWIEVGHDHGTDSTAHAALRNWAHAVASEEGVIEAEDVIRLRTD